MKNGKCQHKKMCELALKRGDVVKWHRCDACPVRDRAAQPEAPSQNTPNFLNKRVVKK